MTNKKPLASDRKPRLTHFSWVSLHQLALVALLLKWGSDLSQIGWRLLCRLGNSLLNLCGDTNYLLLTAGGWWGFSASPTHLRGRPASRLPNIMFGPLFLFEYTKPCCLSWAPPSRFRVARLDFFFRSRRVLIFQFAVLPNCEAFLPLQISPLCWWVEMNRKEM